MRRKMRVAYAGHDFFFSCLLELAVRDDLEVVVCLTEGPEGQPAVNVIELASKIGAHVLTGPPTEETIEIVNSARIDLLVCAAYMYRIPMRHLSVGWAVNVHPTLLPHGRGPNPLPYLASSHGRYCGITVHKLTEEMDKGPLLVREEIEVAPEYSLDDIYLRLFAKAPQALSVLLEDLPGCFARSTNYEGGSYWPAMSGDLLKAGKQSVDEAIALQRTFGMYGFVITVEGGQDFRASLVTATKCEHSFPVGTVVAELRIGTLVALRDGLVRVNKHGALPPVE